MEKNREVVITSGVRTAIGSFGGGLKDVPPCDLGSKVTKSAIERSQINPVDVDHVVFGNVIHTEAKDMYLSRVASINAGIPKEVPAMTLNRLCGSGLQAVVSATQSILLGDADIAIAGGAESMSRAPYAINGARFGHKMGDAPVVDMMLGALHDPFGHGHMGVTAENVATRFQITRETQDKFAVESHNRASKAINEGRFADQIMPFEIETRRGTVVFDTDEHVRESVTIEDIEKLKPVFKKEGSVTAGNSSGINDGAGALVLMDKSEAEQRELQPLAKVLSYGLAGVEPSEMGLGPIPASRIALEKCGLSVKELDVIESNEAFAAQACAVSQELGLDSTKVNPNGGAIALGHPVGASGAIILIKAIYELKRIQGQYGLITMCIGGGQGIAVVIENLK